MGTGILKLAQVLFFEIAPVYESLVTSCHYLNVQKEALMQKEYNIINISSTDNRPASFTDTIISTSLQCNCNK